MTHSATFADLLAACQKEGCPLCRLEEQASRRYLERLFNELVNDYATRLRLRASLGFCAEHARQALDELQGQALGLAIVYDDLLRLVLEQLETRQPVLRPQKKCPACENREEVRAWALSELSKNILSEPLLAALAGSQGLCFGHLERALDHLRVSEKRAALIGLQREIMTRLRAELAEYIRKNDYRFAGEAFGPERDSWRRAVKLTRP